MEVKEEMRMKRSMSKNDEFASNSHRSENFDLDESIKIRSMNVGRNCGSKLIRCLLINEDVYGLDLIQ